MEFKKAKFNFQYGRYEVYNGMFKLLVLLIFLVLLLSVIQCLLMFSSCKEHGSNFRYSNFENIQRSKNSLNQGTPMPPSPKTTAKITKTNKETQMVRQQTLRNFCRYNQTKDQLRKSKPLMNNMFYSEKKEIIYCSIPKAACTNWKRLLQVFDGRMKGLFQVKDKDQLHNMKYSMLRNLNETELAWRRNSYYAFVFVRHPFERLFSAYRNKLKQPPHPGFQKRYGSVILRMFRVNLSKDKYDAGRGVTFREFLMYLISVHQKKGHKAFDEHWQIMTKLCSPCTMKYDFIGKMDTLLEDAEEVLKQTGLYEKYKFPYNATDNYKQSANSVMMRFYSEIPKSFLRTLYNIYRDDFISFGFSGKQFGLEDS